MLPPLAVSETDWPKHIEGDSGVIAIVGNGLTVTETLEVFEQPFTSVPVTTYIEEDVGLASTEVPVVADNPEAGDQSYVLPPLAVRVIDCPMQIAGNNGVTAMVGNGFTVTETLEVLEHPFASVPVII